MTLLHEVLSIELLKEHLANGIIRRQVHPQYPRLFIYNYTEQAQFQRIWDAATNVCRGLIVEGEEFDGPGACDRVIARGFNKFHNLNTEYVPETMEANLPKEVPLVTTKLDGSMGILYQYDGKVWMATRGSFASDQAKWATDWIRERLVAFDWVEQSKTAVFEVIFKENRIVVDYDFEGCVLIGGMENASGKEVSREELEDFARLNNLPIVQKFNKTLAECAAEDNPNEEGYVLTYASTGLKVKVKFAEYVRLHRVLTGLNPKAIWELLAKKADSTVDLWVHDEKMPDGFKKWLSGWVVQLRERYAAIEAQAKEVFVAKPEGTRKDVALYFQKTPQLCSVLFAMLDGKQYDEIIWDKIKPKASDTFKVDGE